MIADPASDVMSGQSPKTNMPSARAINNWTYVIGAMSAADARVVAIKISQCAKLAVTATTAQRATMVQSGMPICNVATPEK
mgnify:CR=1 FL=1